MIKMIRVDYRLLHGQVAVSWTSMLGADCILLVSDTVLDDKLRLSALALAKPEGCKVVVKNTEAAIAALKSGVTDKYKLFIVCETVQQAGAVAKAAGVPSINLGNIPFSDDARQASKSIFLTAENEDYIKSLIDDGVELFVQMVPSESKIDARKIVQ